MKKINGNRFLYKYTVSNSSNSDLPIVGIALDLDDYVTVKHISGPPNWGHIYFPPKRSAIVWGQFNSFDFPPIMQGGSAMFSFESQALPGLISYEIDGLDATGQIPDHKLGKIAGPSLDISEPGAE